MISAIMAAVVLAAGLVKGAIGFGFPSLATPLLSLVTDVKTAVVVLIVPNIVMDSIQFIRRGAPLATVRRFSGLLVSGAVGVVLGTRVLTMLSPRAATLTLGLVV
ncbi:MAG TPA: TSUP family transporter, partial [Methylomirabilota bacterium]